VVGRGFLRQEKGVMEFLSVEEKRLRFSEKVERIEEEVVVEMIGVRRERLVSVSVSWLQNFPLVFASYVLLQIRALKRSQLEERMEEMSESMDE